MEIIEDEKYLWFGCRSCMRYVRRRKAELARLYIRRRGRGGFFDWRGMVEELYHIYASSFF
ncbi:MAG: hypothetical protein QXI84_10730 [Thermofilaceae archaeon]